MLKSVLKFSVLLCLTSLFPGVEITGQQDRTPEDYRNYHSQINQAENQLAEVRYAEALATYETIFDVYDFVFCRDYKIAAQVAVYLNDNQRALQIMEKAFASGWEWKDAKHLKSLESLRDDPAWSILEDSYDSLRTVYLNRIDSQTRETVHEMFKKDQKKALGALMRIGNKAQQAYGEKKFVPHSELQLAELMEIINTKGYPGEMQIGNDFWGSTILSHHNSISPEYNQSDTLYLNLRPYLLQALRAGEISPYEFAMIEDWKIATTSEWNEPGYGYLNAPSTSTLSETDSLRLAIGLRTVALRNTLVEVEEITGINLFLPDWVKGKIEIEKGE
jgi:hypothetical protein